jgi:acetolactate synthase-1/2/3 large subunit
MQIRPSIEQANAHDGPVVIDFIVEEEENVYPMIKAGGTIDDLVEEPVPERLRR